MCVIGVMIFQMKQKTKFWTNWAVIFKPEKQPCIKTLFKGYGRCKKQTKKNSTPLHQSTLEFMYTVMYTVVEEVLLRYAAYNSGFLSYSVNGSGSVLLCSKAIPSVLLLSSIVSW